MNERTLGSVFSGGSNPPSVSDVSATGGSTANTFQTYVTILGVYLAHRFPDVNDLLNVPYSEIQRIFEALAACTSVATGTWSQAIGAQSDAQRQGTSSRGQRSAA